MPDEKLHWQARLRCVTSRVPTALTGLALGLAGLGGLCLDRREVLGGGPGVLALGYLMLGLAGGLLGLFGVKAVFCWAVCWDELKRPSTISAYGPVPMALMVVAGQLPYGQAGVWLGSGLQLLLLFWFLVVCARTRTLPEPFWFPVVCGGGMTVIQGARAGMWIWWLRASWWTALAGALVLFPVVTYRVLKHTTNISPGPSVALLMAPASLVALSYFSLTSTQTSSWPVSYLLCGWSSLGLVVCCCAVWRRRRFFAAQPFSPAWAAFTFPLVSTASAAAALAEAEGWLVLVVYAGVLVFVAAVACLGVLVGYCWRAKAWCFEDIHTAEAAHRENKRVAKECHLHALSHQLPVPSAMLSMQQGALLVTATGGHTRGLGLSYGFENPVPCTDLVDLGEYELRGPDGSAVQRTLKRAWSVSVTRGRIGEHRNTIASRGQFGGKLMHRSRGFAVPSRNLELEQSELLIAETSSAATVQKRRARSLSVGSRSVHNFPVGKRRVEDSAGKTSRKTLRRQVRRSATAGMSLADQMKQMNPVSSPLVTYDERGHATEPRGHGPVLGANERVDRDKTDLVTYAQGTPGFDPEDPPPVSSVSSMEVIDIATIGITMQQLHAHLPY